MNTIELWQHLRAHGPIAELDFVFDIGRIERELAAFHENWTQYNPYKPRISRQGLSVTSLDGGLTGDPDLSSLAMYNRDRGTNFRETDFTRPTPAYEKVSGIRPILDFYSQYLARSHFIRLNMGGFFPPHRDDPRMDEHSTFRVLVPLSHCEKNEFVFLLEDERVWLEPGHAYFVDTAKVHSVFSFVDNSIQLVLNVRMCEDSLRRTLEKIRYR